MLSPTWLPHCLMPVSVITVPVCTVSVITDKSYVTNVPFPQIEPIFDFVLTS